MNADQTRPAKLKANINQWWQPVTVVIGALTAGTGTIGATNAASDWLVPELGIWPSITALGALIAGAAHKAVRLVLLETDGER